MQSQFDFPYNFPKRRSAYCLDSLHGAWNFSHAKHSIVYDCCKAELEDQAEFLVFTFFFHFNPSANIMKVGCRLIISTFRTELSPNSPCIAALKTEMFGTFIFKHAQATKSHGVGIKSANSICCKKPRVEGPIILCLGTLLHISACLDRHLIMKILDFFSAMLTQLRQKLAPRSSTNK